MSRERLSTIPGVSQTVSKDWKEALQCEQKTSSHVLRCEPNCQQRLEGSSRKVIIIIMVFLRGQILFCRTIQNAHTHIQTHTRTHTHTHTHIQTHTQTGTRTHKYTIHKSATLTRLKQIIRWGLNDGGGGGQQQRERGNVAGLK